MLFALFAATPAFACYEADPRAEEIQHFQPSASGALIFWARDCLYPTDVPHFLLTRDDLAIEELDVAARFCDASGFDCLAVVDLEGTLAGDVLSFQSHSGDWTTGYDIHSIVVGEAQALRDVGTPMLTEVDRQRGGPRRDACEPTQDILTLSISGDIDGAAAIVIRDQRGVDVVTQIADDKGRLPRSITALVGRGEDVCLTPHLLMTDGTLKHRGQELCSERRGLGCAIAPSATAWLSPLFGIAPRHRRNSTQRHSLR